MSDGRWDDEGASGEEGRLLPGDAYERLALQSGQIKSIESQLGDHTEALMDCASIVSDLEEEVRELAMELCGGPSAHWKTPRPWRQITLVLFGRASMNQLLLIVISIAHSEF